MTCRYLAYGLHCVSNLPIPGFWRELVTSDPMDLALWLGPQPPDWFRESVNLPAQVRYTEPPVSETADVGLTVFSLGPEEFFEFSYTDGTRSLTDGAGARLWVSNARSFTPDDTGAYLRGPLMGFVLRRRGITAFHASAASIGERAVVFCGTTEAGKSTTAAALALRGIPILSDDIAALREKDGGFHVVPGCPRICLWPDAVSALLGAPDALPPLTPTWEKCFLPLDNERAKFEEQRQPLGVVYLLAPRSAEGSTPRVEEVGAQQAVIELVQNTYMNWLLDREQRAAEFDTLTRLVAQVPVRRIVPHADPARLGALCDLILADAEHWSVPPTRAASLPLR